MPIMRIVKLFFPAAVSLLVALAVLDAVIGPPPKPPSKTKRWLRNILNTMVGWLRNNLNTIVVGVIIGLLIYAIISLVDSREIMGFSPLHMSPHKPL